MPITPTNRELLGDSIVADIIDDDVESLDTTYSSDKIETLLTGINQMRGVAVFVQTTEPIEKQLNDIWIQL